MPEEPRQTATAGSGPRRGGLEAAADAPGDGPISPPTPAPCRGFRGPLRWDMGPCEGAG